jgi:UDP-3-O-[3-hydroxymyristoyl] glucosamine N-acyltransferase
MVTIGKVADWLGVSAPLLDGEITQVASIEDAGPGCVVFAVDKEAMARALASMAGAILANTSLEDAESPPDPRVLWVGDARYAFAVVGQQLRGRGFKAGIHPSAVVGEGVRIGQGTRIGPGVVLEDGAVVGSDCNLMARVVVHAQAVLGDRVVAQAGSI